MKIKFYFNEIKTKTFITLNTITEAQYPFLYFAGFT